MKRWTQPGKGNGIAWPWIQSQESINSAPTPRHGYDLVYVWRLPRWYSHVAGPGPPLRSRLHATNEML